MPYIFVLHASKGAIVIKSIEQNFIHLIGVQHSSLIQIAKKQDYLIRKQKIENTIYLH